jgi:hypothetical protein
LVFTLNTLKYWSWGFVWIFWKRARKYGRTLQFRKVFERFPHLELIHKMYNIFNSSLSWANFWRLSTILKTVYVRTLIPRAMRRFIIRNSALFEHRIALFCDFLGFLFLKLLKFGQLHSDLICHLVLLIISEIFWCSRSKWFLKLLNPIIHVIQFIEKVFFFDFHALLTLQIESIDNALAS